MKDFIRAFFVTGLMFLLGALNAFVETGKFNVSALLEALGFFPFMFIAVVGWIFYHKDRY
ncbi:hypothetical protein [Actinobacillus porcinus]|uniref:hypothetical protein n=1 Tax=Actinobacillus porcinus TaxID=51048 RepID=UPI002354F05B|nr:hypothetical protein [Actinobacillus porcinus]MCI5763248.1 hypothetical protein [Actinobacillus porcinus]MDY5420685.1 hypothetical protein [Actinobacillus porcinus]MDY5848336.1 hypothetical protein [Actinobacillus porcinus]MDY6216401.1 hypothetical protein [Actinobacillus porcinus]